MSDRIKTVKGRVIFLLIMFALLITLFALFFSFNTIRSFQQMIAVRSAEFDLQLVAGLIEQDLRDLTTLGYWCGHSDLIVRYFRAEEQVVFRSLEAWDRLQEEFINNRAGRYVRRLIVADISLTRFLQVGNSVVSSYPVTVYNLEKIFEIAAALNSASPPGNNFAWLALVPDPYIFSSSSMIVPFVYPVYSAQDGGEIGTVFLAATAGIITDKFRRYKLPEGSRLYLELGDRRYLIGEDRLVSGDFPYTIVREDQEDAGTVLVSEARDGEGRRRTLVSYPVREGITLTQVLSPAYYLPFSGAWPMLAAGLGALIILLVIMAWGVNRMIHEIAVLMDKQIVDERNKRDLEYRMLQSQINPHFLYNTLNSIKWMATIQNAGGIAEMTTALSRFLRTLSKDNRKVVPLRDELALLEDYLLIQKYRYGGSVNFECQAGEDLLDTPIPRFTLQPLAENAIFHGIEPKGSGRIVLSAEKKEGDVLVYLVDDGVGMSGRTIAEIAGGFEGEGPPTVQPAGTGLFQDLGIHNVDERLRYAFGEGYGLSIKSEEGKYTAVTIRLPGAGT